MRGSRTISPTPWPATGDEAALIADFAIHTYYAGDQPRALSAAVRAVHALADASAFREALEHAEHALELWPHVADAEACAGISHGELLAVAGQVGASSGVTGPALAYAKAALEELEASASPERLAALLIDIYNVAFAAEAFDTAWATARRLHGLVDGLPASRIQVDALTRHRRRALVHWAPARVRRVGGEVNGDCQGPG